MRLSRKLSEYLLIGAMVLLFARDLSNKLSDQFPIDHFQFWIVGQAISNLGATDVYSPHARVSIPKEYLEELKAQEVPVGYLNAAHYRQPFQPAGTPFLYAFFHLISTDSYADDFRNYSLLCFFLFVLAVGVFGVSQGHSIAACFVMLSFYMTFFSYTVDMRVGNVNQLQLGIIALALLLRWALPGSWGGFSLGLLLGWMLMLKPNVILVVLFLILGEVFQRRWKQSLVASIGISVGVLTAFLISSYFFGSFECWQEWYRFFPESAEVGFFWQSSFVSVVSESLHVSHNLVGLVSFLVVLGILWTGLKNRHAILDRDQILVLDCQLVALGLTTFLFVSRWIHNHYFLLTLPLAFVALRASGFERNSALSRGYRLLRFLIVVAALLVIRGSDFLGFEPSPLPKFSDFLAILTLLMIGCAQFLSERRAMHAPQYVD